MGSTVALAFGTIFCVVSLFFVALAFSTDNWIKFVVDDKEMAKTFPTEQEKTTAMKKFWYHSRHRGLFKECLQNSTVSRLLDGVTVIDNSGGCFSIEYEIPERIGSAGYSSDYWIRVHLMRCTLAFFVVSMIFLLIGCVLGSVACWRTSEQYAKNTGIVIFVGAFFVAFAMAVFHGAEYLEKNKIKDENSFPSNWDSALAKSSRRIYDYSYIMGWVGVVCSAVAAAIFLVTAWLMSMRSKDEKSVLESYSMRDNPSMRNRAYEYVEKPGLDYYTQPVVSGAYPPQAYYVGPAYDADPRSYGDFDWGWQRY